MAASFDYEELLPFFQIQNGNVEIFEGPSTGGFPGGPPINAIQTDQDWGVEIKWQTTGLLNFIIAGTWRLQLFLEQMGGGEFSIPNVYGVATQTFVSSPHLYSVTMNVPKGIVPKGTYKLVFQMTFTGPAPATKPGPIACFAEYPKLLEFYEA